MIKYISSKALIGRFIQECGIEETNFASQVPIWIEDAIQIMGVPKYYVYKNKLINIDRKQGLIPCDIEFLHSVYVAKDNDFSNMNYIRRLYIRDAPIINQNVHIPQTNHHSAVISGRYIYTTFDKGVVYMIYKGVPCDNEGYPLVPNDAQFNEAIRYYFIKTLSLGGYKHPILSFKDAYDLWEKHYPRAANSLNAFDLQEHQEFTEMWTDRLIGDIHQIDYLH
jgi:hypothetical protein